MGIFIAHVGGRGEGERRTEKDREIAGEGKSERQRSMHKQHPHCTAKLVISKKQNKGGGERGLSALLFRRAAAELASLGRGTAVSNHPCAHGCFDNQYNVQRGEEEQRRRRRLDSPIASHALFLAQLGSTFTLSREGTLVAFQTGAPREAVHIKLLARLLPFPKSFRLSSCVQAVSRSMIASKE